MRLVGVNYDMPAEGGAVLSVLSSAKLQNSVVKSLRCDVFFLVINIKKDRKL